MLRLTHAGHPIFLSAEHIVAIVPVVITMLEVGCDVKTWSPAATPAPIGSRRARRRLRA
jgi:hypothetical protein